MKKVKSNDPASFGANILRMISNMILKFKKDALFIVKNLNKILLSFVISFVLSFTIYLIISHSFIIHLTIKNEFFIYWSGVINNLKFYVILIIILISILFYKKEALFFKRRKVTKAKIPFLYTPFDNILRIIIYTIIFLISFYFDFIKNNYILIGIILFCLILLIVLHWIIIISLRKIELYLKYEINNKINNDSEFPLSDEVLNPKKDKDLLKRENFINQIMELLDSKSSFPLVIGIYGEWGTGKSSILGMLDNKLKLKNNILINFNPWFYKDERNVLIGFYRILIKSLNEQFYIPKLSSLLNQYCQKQIIEFKFNFIKIKYENQNNSLNEIKERISEITFELGEKVIIIIDDVDRLTSKMILLICKLVRLNFDIKNVIFILAFDPEIVITNIDKEFNNNGKEYLEKIVNYPIRIPQIDAYDIKKYIIDKLKVIFNEYPIKDEERIFKEEFIRKYDKILYKLFNTLRDAKRYLNGLYNLIGELHGKVDLIDLSILEIIRIKYYEIYLDIIKYPWFYVNLNWSSNDRIYSPHNDLNLETLKNIILDYFNKKLDVYNEKEIIYEILSEIFPLLLKVKGKQFVILEENNEKDITNDNKYFLRKKKIGHPDSLPYFYVKNTLEIDLSFNFIETLLIYVAKDKYYFENKLYEIRDKNSLYSFLKSLRIHIENLDIKICKIIIKCLIKNNQRLLSHPQDSICFGLIYNIILHIINNEYKREDIKKQMNYFINNSRNIKMIFYVIKIYQDSKQKFRNIIKEYKLDKYKTDILQRMEKDFININEDIFRSIKDDEDLKIIISDWVTKFDEMKRDSVHKNRIEDYLIDRIKEVPRNGIRLLNAFLIPSYNQIDIDSFKKVLNYDKFAQMFLALKTNNTLKDEEEKLINLFLESSTK